MRMRSIWKGVVLAENDDTVAVEASQYFPRTSLSKEYFFASDHRSTCPWKALASYLSVSLGGEINPDAAREFESPSIPARMVKDRVAFWRGISVVSVDPTEATASSS